MTAVLILGLLLNAIALPIAGRRVWFLYRLITSGHRRRLQMREEKALTGLKSP